MISEILIILLIIFLVKDLILFLKDYRKEEDIKVYAEVSKSEAKDRELKNIKLLKKNGKKIIYLNFENDIDEKDKLDLDEYGEIEVYEKT